MWNNLRTEIVGMWRAFRSLPALHQVGYVVVFVAVEAAGLYLVTHIDAPLYAR